jgi:hypothetical protein
MPARMAEDAARRKEAEMAAEKAAEDARATEARQKATAEEARRAAEAATAVRAGEERRRMREEAEPDVLATATSKETLIGIAKDCLLSASIKGDESVLPLAWLVVDVSPAGVDADVVEIALKDVCLGSSEADGTCILEGKGWVRFRCVSRYHRYPSAAGSMQVDTCTGFSFA